MEVNTVNISILDDDEFVLSLFEVALRELKHPPIKVLLFDDVKEALLKKNVLDCDLFISDIRMPEMNGVEVIKRLRDIAGKRHIPAALITSLHRDEIAEQYELPKQTTIFTKPIDFEAIKKLIMAVYASKGLTELVTKQ